MATDGEVGHEQELFASVLGIRLDLVAHAERKLSRNHHDLAIGVEVRAGYGDLVQGVANGGAVVVGVQIEECLEEQLVLAAGGV